MRSLLTLTILLICATVALPQQASSPSSTREAVGPSLGKVTPGGCYTNADGVKVCNTGSAGDGDFTVDPKTGSTSSSTTVEAKNDAIGTVDGIDGNDTVNVSSGADVKISGTGGTVDVSSGGSTGSVTNTGTEGGGDITVKTGSIDVHVPPGSTITFG